MPDSIARLDNSVVIDLHTHTTASDGRCSPEELVARAAAAGVGILSVTDHDTVAGHRAAAAACAAAHIELVAGIEITSVLDGQDVHILGYFIDPGAEGLLTFLAEQRRRRLVRVRQMIERLAQYGIRLDRDAVLQPALDDSTRTAGRPWIARALVQEGHVTDASEAFARWLGRGRPAFVPRVGPEPGEVFERIHDAGGISSLAHPSLSHRDEWIPGFAAGGLDAIEAFHPDHDETATARYLALCRTLNLVATGGSDYHADEAHGARWPGSVSLPQEEYERLAQLSHRR